VAVGSTLTCHPGTWTANARAIGYRWDTFVGGSSGTVRVDSTGPTYTLTGHEVGFLSCLVDATSSAGTSTGVAGIQIPDTPRPVNVFTTILGLPLPVPGAPPHLPAPGTVLTCQPATYSNPAVQVTVSWTLSSSTAPTETIASGPQLTLTTGLLTRLAGNSLACVSSASIGGFYPDNRASSLEQMADLAPPYVMQVTISPNLYSVPPSEGSEVNCDADLEGDPAETVSYTWAMQSTDPASVGDVALDADARILGHDPTYTMTQQDVDDFATQYLVCRVEASSWQGTDAWWDWY
jgi:hypothetical protein